MYHSVVPESDASRPIAGSTHMSILQTRTLLRPAAHHLSLSLVEKRSFESVQFEAFGTSTSTSCDDNGSTTLPSVPSRPDRESVLSVTPLKSSNRTLLSALPTGSMYSQESCPYQTTPVRTDTRRFGIALESLGIDLWPLATSPLSASVGAFILNLRKSDQSQEIPQPSVNFVAETASYLVTSPKSFDATMAMLDEITTCFQIPAGEQDSLALLPQPSPDWAVVSVAPACKGDIVYGTSASTWENGVESGKGNPLLPTRGLGGLLSRISLPTTKPTKPHTSTAVVTSSILNGSAGSVSMVPRQDAASLVKRHRTLRKRPPSTPRKQTFRREQASLLAQGSFTVPTQEFPMPPLPAISISPLAVSFGKVNDKITEHGSNTPIPHDDWETIGVAF